MITSRCPLMRSNSGPTSASTVAIARVVHTRISSAAEASGIRQKNRDGDGHDERRIHSYASWADVRVEGGQAETLPGDGIFLAAF